MRKEMLIFGNNNLQEIKQIYIFALSYGEKFA